MQDPRQEDVLIRITELERELLAVRRELGAARPRAALPTGSFDAVRVLIATDEYAIQGTAVREIVRYARLTRVSGASRVVAGALNLRGEVVIVMSVPRRLGLGEARLDLKTAVVVVEARGKLAGLLVDRVTDVVRLDGADLAPASTVLADAPYVSGVATVNGHLVQLLDIEELVNVDEIEALQARMELETAASAPTSVDEGWET